MPDGSELHLHGHVRHTQTGRTLAPAELLAFLQQTGPAGLAALDGGYVLAWRDGPSGTWRLANDRLGTLPVVWSATPTRLDFGPFVADLPDTPTTPDPVGVVSFLTLGYCLGGRTLIDGVSHLTPASVLTISQDGDLSHDHYWDLTYQPDHTLSAADHAHRLHGEIHKAVDQLAPDGVPVGLFLSGGWDCRSLLGAQLRLQRPPAIVVTNGKDDTVPGTDTALARRLASDFGLEYRFCRRRPELAGEFSIEGIRRCELATDTAPEVFGQHHQHDGFFSGVAAVLKGDEIWGWQDEAVDRASAVGQVMPTHTPALLQDLLAPGLAADAEALFQREVDGILAGCPDGTWNERKDYLYLKGRVCRYIFGVGASDEVHCQVRRPLLSHNVIDAVAAIPDRLRVQKNAFLEMLARHEKRLYGYRRNHVGHIADYYTHMAPFIRDRATQTLDSSVMPLLAADTARSLAAAFDPGHSPATARDLKGHLKNTLLDRWGWRWYRSNTYIQRSHAGFAGWTASRDRVVFRLWLLLEFFGSFVV